MKRHLNTFVTKHNVNKIRNLRTTNPKKYWKILNGKKQKLHTHTKKKRKS